MSSCDVFEVSVKVSTRVRWLASSSFAPPIARRCFECSPSDLQCSQSCVRRVGVCCVCIGSGNFDWIPVLLFFAFVSSPFVVCVCYSAFLSFLELICFIRPLCVIITDTPCFLGAYVICRAFLRGLCTYSLTSSKILSWSKKTS